MCINTDYMDNEAGEQECTRHIRVGMTPEGHIRTPEVVIIIMMRGYPSYCTGWRRESGI